MVYKRQIPKNEIYGRVVKYFKFAFYDSPPPPTSLSLPLQLFETVKGMPSFMLNNGLLKLLCQLIAITTDHSSLKRQADPLLACLLACLLVC